MKNIEKEIVEVIKKLKDAPLLFVGSGLSQRYIGTPTWIDLLKKLIKKIDTNPIAYESYKNRAKMDGYSTCIEAKIASLIEKDYNDKWFREDEFEESRNKNIELVKNNISPFKIEIADIFKSMNKNDFKENMKSELKLLEEVGNRSIVGVITTNYDCVIENIFSNYKYDIYVGQEELLFNAVNGIGEIFKIHGSCLEPKSIVINEEDYVKYNEKNTYLVAKLLTLFIEHPVVFIGYNLGDPNIKEILSNIVKCLSKEKLFQLKNRFIFVEWNNTNEDDNISTYECSGLGEGKSLTMIKISLNDFSILYKALLQNKVTYNPRLIKKLKNDIYNIVVSSEPTESVKVLVDIDDSRLEEVETVVGFSVIEQLKDKGYDGIEPLDLFFDVIYETGYNGKQLDSSKVVESSLPRILIYDQSIPMHKYVNDYSGELPKKVMMNYKDKYELYLNKNIIHDIENNKVVEKSIRELRENNTDTECLNLIPRMRKENIDVNELQMFIKNYLENHPDALISKDKKNQSIKTNLKRLIKIYDYLKYYSK